MGVFYSVVKHRHIEPINNQREHMTLEIRFSRWRLWGRVSWEVMSGSLAASYQCFGGTWR